MTTRQNYILKIYKADRSLVHVSRKSRNQPGWRCVGVYEFCRDEAGMERECKELRALYPSSQFKMEFFPETIKKETHEPNA